VVGGNLQGVEATYLAHQAGWEVVVLDRDPAAPAAGLSDRALLVDILSEVPVWWKTIREVDFVIPALEDVEVLRLLHKVTRAEGVPLAYDPEAYHISASKLRSNRLFAQIGLPVPKPWPGCDFPVIVKPSDSSGSRGVSKISGAGELAAFQSPPDGKSGEWIIQEFVDGQVYSLEVLGCGGEFTTLQVTEIHVDAAYDCKRVVAPARLSPVTEKELHAYSLAIARALRLNGVMDVEAVLGPEGFKILEIDARLPSQTPTAVYHARGWNMVTMLHEIFAKGNLPAPPVTPAGRAVIYEQIRVSRGVLEVLGERIISKVGPLRHWRDFWGADEAVTNYEPERPDWVAILIFTGETHQEVWDKRLSVIDGLCKRLGLVSKTP